MLEWDGTTLKLSNFVRHTQQEEILGWLDNHCAENCLLAITTPLVSLKRGGLRNCDRLLNSHFETFKTGVFPPNRSISICKRATAFASALTERAFHNVDRPSKQSPGRNLIEVHVEASLVQLLRLERAIKYKRGKVSERQADLRALRMLLKRYLPNLTPRLDPEIFPDIPHGREFKAVADQYNAILCAYVAAYWWYWGDERNDVLGNSKSGFIVVPCRPTADVKLADLRQEYKGELLDEGHMDADPIVQFQKWFAEVREAAVAEANAMTLATVSSDGQPSARIVLLKEVTTDGFVFYTNYRSRKGKELAENPRAALVFFWPELSRQVRITGRVTKTTRSEALEYFRTRPRGAQIGAWASWQSSSIPDRELLEARVQRLEEKYQGKDVPLPPTWGGYRLQPDTVEFWHGRPNRLHDRLRYSRTGRRSWTIERLAP